MLLCVTYSEDNPQVIGEASILMAQTCFPDDGLDGGNGHSTVDVLCKLSGTGKPVLFRAH
jgi:chitosanase